MKYVAMIQYGKGMAHTLTGPAGFEAKSDKDAIRIITQSQGCRLKQWTIDAQAKRRRSPLPTIRVMRIIKELVPKGEMMI